MLSFNRQMHSEEEKSQSEESRAERFVTHVDLTEQPIIVSISFSCAPQEWKCCELNNLISSQIGRKHVSHNLPIFTAPSTDRGRCSVQSRNTNGWKSSHNGASSRQQHHTNVVESNNHHWGERKRCRARAGFIEKRWHSRQKVLGILADKIRNNEEGIVWVTRQNRGVGAITGGKIDGFLILILYERGKNARNP